MIGQIKKKFVLLVDDCEEIRDFLKNYLSDSSLKIEVAKNGEEALKKATETSYDLVLLDLHLPDLSGHQVISKLRDLDVKTPVYAFSATDERFVNKPHLMSFGFSGFISKDFISFTFEDLKHSISRILYQPA